MITREHAEFSATRINLLKSIFSVLKGTIWGYIFLVVCFAALAMVYTYTPFPAGLIALFTKIITALSIVFCAVISAKGVSGFGWLHGAAAGIFYTLIRFVAIFIATGSLELGKSYPAMLLVGFILGALGGIIGINFKKT